MIDSGHWLLHGVFAAILRRQDESGCHRTARLSFRTGDNRELMPKSESIPFLAVYVVYALLVSTFNVARADCSGLQPAYRS